MQNNSHSALATAKTEKVTGGNVNYYLVNILHPKYGLPCVVEVEDIIEALDMRFAEANVFKAMVRSAKLSQDLGKPGSSKVYEAEKAVYYSQRTLAKALRRSNGKTERENLFGLDMMIDVKDPKRLTPYQVHVEDFIDALEPTDAEAATLRAILTHCLIGLQYEARVAQVETARAAVTAANQVLELV